MKGELLLLVPNVNLKANSSASLAMLSTRFYIYGALYCLTELLCAIKRHTLYKVLPIGPVKHPLFLLNIILLERARVGIA